MTAPSYTDAESLGAFQALLPTGRVWSRDPDSVLAALSRGISMSATRLEHSATALLVDAFPSTTDALLPEWELSLGLPDPCQGEAATIQSRRDQVVARMVARGGQSIPYFVAFAANLGFAVTVTEFVPARADYLCADDALLDNAWAFAWQINAPQAPITYFVADASVADEALGSWGSNVLECELGRIAPAHTKLIFAYPEGSGMTASLGEFVLDRDNLA